MEDLPILKQVFSLCLWLQTNTKLRTLMIMDGKNDVTSIEVYAGEKPIIDFKLEAFSKKSEERINIELKLIVTQLVELKNDKHFQE